ncbi:hypothetical protein DB32_000159 [Sandaracinus amylolyticus]|uniref:Uncharacterized protein n=2 Tax=Sandaracinus amylolyticus TaxID=927083 RepID=A0A0F6VYR0_9BACT|nr:hypothetical protein DB32_000159 [Sandaracinus amylolyticus]
MLVLAPVITLIACSTEPSPPVYRSALTGEECVPDPGTMIPPERGSGHGRGGHNSPTGIPGDNIDDPHSGKVDCLYDGNSGQGNDRDGCFPRPGCDAEGCCEVPDPDPTPDAGAPVDDVDAGDLI